MITKYNIYGSLIVTQGITISNKTKLVYIYIINKL